MNLAKSPNLIVIAVLGKRACGKTTIAKKVSKTNGFFHLEMSHLLKTIRTQKGMDHLRLRVFVDKLFKEDLYLKSISELKEVISKQKKIVITGIRHIEEIEYLKSIEEINQIRFIYLRLGFFRRLIRSCKRAERTSVLEFFVEEFYSIKWKDYILRKHCDFFLNNISLEKSLTKVGEVIKCL